MRNGYIQGNYIKGKALLLIVYQDGGKKWYRTGNNRKVSSVVTYFRTVNGFKYGKIFSYDSDNKIVGSKLYWFNENNYGSSF